MGGTFAEVTGLGEASRAHAGYILERASDPEKRVAVVVINRKHLQSVMDIKDFCKDSSGTIPGAVCADPQVFVPVAHLQPLSEEYDLEPPRFIVCTRRKPEDRVEEWGVNPRDACGLDHLPGQFQQPAIAVPSNLAR